jgi:uncharacterized protein (DUF433 family)
LPDDPRERPRYTITKGAFWIGISPTTLRTWVVGPPYPLEKDRQNPPVIPPADPVALHLSFNNLVEAHVMRALRTRHNVTMAVFRQALAQTAKRLHTERPLLSDALLGKAGELLLARLAKPSRMPLSVGLVIQQLLRAHLGRIDRDRDGAPLRLFPITPQGLAGPKIVVLDPQMAGGRPCIASTGVLTALLVERLDAGHSREALARDYLIEEHEIDEAVLFERAP